MLRGAHPWQAHLCRLDPYWIGAQPKMRKARKTGPFSQPILAD